MAGYVDLDGPTTLFTPLAGTTISENTTIGITVTDTILNGTSIATLQWTNATDSWNSTVSFNGSWSSTMSALNANLEDGTVTISVLAKDWLGNSQTVTLNSWTLNTTMTRTIVNFDTTQGMINIGSYIGEDVRFTATPPTGGSFTSTFRHSNGSTSGGHTSQQTSAQTWGFSGMESGIVWLNITTTDAYGRTAIDVYSYTVDATVTSLVQFSIPGAHTSINGTKYVPLYSTISLANLNDDAGGSGYASVSCTLNNVSQPISNTNQIYLVGQSNLELNKTIECKIIDRIGNVGPTATYQVIQDGKGPDISHNLNPGNTLGLNSSIQYSCIDTVPSSTQKISYSHQNISSYSNGTVWLNGSQPILNQLSLLQTGYLQIEYYCIDLLGNIGSSSISGLYFTLSAPYVEIIHIGGTVYQAPSGNKYMNSNTEINLTYKSNGNGEGTINITVFKQSNITMNLTTNQSVTLNFTNYSDGNYRIQIETCSELYCSISHETFTLDNTGPTNPTMITNINPAPINSGSQVKVGKNTLLIISNGNDILSGEEFLNCESGIYNNNFSQTQSMTISPYNSNILPHNSTQAFSCRTVDRVGNPSSWVTISLTSDFISPNSRITVTEVENYVFTDSQLSIQCLDENSLNSSNLNIQMQNGSQLNYTIDMNSSYEFSYFSSFNNQNQNLSLQLSCIDSYGNVGNTNTSSHMYMAAIGGVNWIKQNILVNGNINYLGNGSTIEINPTIRVGSFSIQAQSNGNSFWWSNQSANTTVVMNHTNWNSIFANLQPNSQIEIKVYRTVIGTSVGSVSSLGIYQRIIAPNLDGVGNTVLSNGTSTQATLTQTPCDLIQIVTTIEQSQTSLNVNNSFYITMPFGTSENINSVIQITDCVENTREVNITLIRDVSLPNLSVEGILNGITTLNQEISINVSDNYAITNLTVQIFSSNTTQIICYVVCKFVLPTSFQFSDGDAGRIYIKVETASGEIVIQNYLFVIDAYVANPSYNRSQSTNVVGMFIGPNSNLIFQSQEPARVFCVSIQSRTEQNCAYNVSQIMFSPPSIPTLQNLTLRVNVTDYYGNFAESFTVLTYIPNAPNLTKEFYTNSGSGWIQIQTNSTIEFSIEIFGNMSQTSNNGTIFVNSQGNHTVNCRLTDGVGNSNNCTITILFDNTDSIINLVLPTSIFLGYDSTFGIQMADSVSSIKYYSLTVSNNLTNCSIEYDLSSHNYSTLHTLGNLMGQQNCSLMKNPNYPIMLQLLVRNNVGRTSIASINTSYFGNHEPGFVSGSNFTISQSGVLYVSEHTTLRCATNHPVQSNLTLTVQGGNSTIEPSQDVNWTNGNGVLTCDFLDILGNRWNQSWNVNHIADTTAVEITVLNGYTNVTKLGAANIYYSVNSSKSLSLVNIWLDGILYQTNANSQGILQMNTTAGGHLIEMEVTTVLGYSSTQSAYVFFDGDAPHLSLSESLNYDVNESQQKVTTQMNTISISVIYYDSLCGSNNSMVLENATLLSMANQKAIISVNGTTTEFTISITDCVGWKNMKTYQMIRKVVVEPLNHSNYDRMIIENSTITIGQTGMFELSTIDQLTVNLTCSSSIGEISCIKIGNNQWTVTFTNITSSGMVSITGTDTIGNINQKTYYLILDNVAPTCEMPGIEQNGILYLNNLAGFEVICEDESNILNSITIIQGISVQNSSVLLAGGSRSLIVQLTNSSTMELMAIDYFGNIYIKNLTVIYDGLGPNVSCISSSNSKLLTSETKLRSSIAFTCNVHDLLPTTTQYTWINNFTNTIVVDSENYSGNFDLTLDGLFNPHGSTFRLIITSFDQLGNSNIQLFNVEFDKVAPTIEFESFDSFGYPIESNYIFHRQGEYLVKVIDTSDTIAGMSITCSSGDTYTDMFTSEMNISVSQQEMSNCGSEFLIEVFVLDEAGNAHSESRNVKIDSSPPTLVIQSSCPYQNDAILILIRTCNLAFGSSDDSGPVVSITGHYNDTSQYDILGILEINLDQFENNVIQEYTVVLIDKANRQSQYTIQILVQPELFVELTREACTQEQLSCYPSIIYDYDYLITGQVSLSLEIPSAVNYTSITNESGDLCPVNLNYDCLEIFSYPYMFSDLSGGYWIWTYDVKDNLGRTYSTEKRILVDTDELQLIDVERNIHTTQLAENELLICERCNLTVFIENSHKPTVQVNSKNYSVENIALHQWKIVVPMNKESINIGQGDLQLFISNTIGTTLELRYYISYIGSYTITPVIGQQTTCFDNPQWLIEGDSDYLCLYSYSDLYDGSSMLNLYPNIDILQPTSFTVAVQQCFLGTGCNTELFGSFEGEENFSIPLELPQDTLARWMQYNVSIYMPYFQNPIELSLALVNEDEFVSKTEIIEDASYVNISEAGDVQIHIELKVNASVGGIEGLNRENYMLLLKESIEHGSCKLRGDFVTLLDSEKGEYEIDGTTVTVNCGPLVQIVGDRLIIESSSDWEGEMQIAEISKGPFYLFKPKYFELEYEQPLSTSQEKERKLLDRNILVEPNILDDSSPIIDLGVCQDSLRKPNSFLDQTIDWGELVNCLNTIRDEDGLHSFGIALTLNSEEDENPTKITILCGGTNKSLPSSMNDWLDSSWLDENDCKHKNLENLQHDMLYESIVMDIISCDLQCEYSGGEHAFITSPFPNQEISMVQDPQTNEDLIYIGIILTVIAMATMFLFRFISIRPFELVRGFVQKYVRLFPKSEN